MQEVDQKFDYFAIIYIVEGKLMSFGRNHIKM